MLDEAVFEEKRLFFGSGYEKIQVCNAPHEKPYRVTAVTFVYIRANAGTEILGLANVDHRLLGVAHEITAGTRGHGGNVELCQEFLGRGLRRFHDLEGIPVYRTCDVCRVHTRE